MHGAKLAVLTIAFSVGTALGATFVLCAGCLAATDDARIRVACIGDSITYGYAMTNRVGESYPVQLQRMLGDRYDVRNFGDPGAGVYLHEKRQDRPRAWRLRDEYGPARDFKPDIVVCNLGINDAVAYLQEFVHGANGRPMLERGLFRRQYADLLASFERDGRRPRYIIWTRLGPTGKTHALRDKPNAFVMEADLEGVAQDVGAETLDMYTPLVPFVETPHFAADGIHPEGGAQKVIAEITAAKILGAFRSSTLGVSAGALADAAAPYYFGPPKARQAVTNRAFTGIPSICATPKGRLWATWYAGTTPAEDLNNYIVLATSADGGRTWKEVLVTDPDEGGPSRCFDANLWVTPDGRLQWNWSERLPGHGGPWGCDGDRVFVRYGDDPESETMNWTEPRVIGEGVAMGKSLRLSSGEWVMPVCKWFGAPSSQMYVSADNGTTWTCRGGVTYPANPRQFDEHQFVENADGVLQCFSRTYLGVGHSVSRDRGRTWTPGELTWIPQPCSRFFVRRLGSGRLLMVKHGPMKMDLDWSFCGRERLMAFLSEDDGATWKGALMLDERKAVSYPDGDQLPDGSVVVVYDRERTGAREILMARFTEADVLAGKLVSDGSSLRNLVSKGTQAALTK